MERLFLLLLVMATLELVTSQVLREHPTFTNYLKNGDIDAFCDDYYAKFDRECKDSISAEIEDQFIDRIKHVNDYKLRSFMDQHVLTLDPALNLSDEECDDFYREIHKTPNTEVRYVVERYIRAKGYNFDRRDIRALKTLRVSAEDIRASDICNVGYHARDLGEISKGWKLKYLNPIISKFNEGLEMMRTAPFGGSDEDTSHRSDPMLHDIHHIEAIGCSGRTSNRFIMSNLGLRATQFAEGNSTLKSILVFLAKGVCYYRKYSAMDSYELYSRSAAFVRQHLIGIASVLTTLFTACFLGSKRGSELREYLVWEVIWYRKYTPRRSRAIRAVSAFLLLTAGLHQGIISEELAYFGTITSAVYSIGFIKKYATAKTTIDVLFGFGVLCYATSALSGCLPILWLMCLNAMRMERMFRTVRREFRHSRRSKDWYRHQDSDSEDPEDTQPRAPRAPHHLYSSIPNYQPVADRFDNVWLLNKL